MSPEGSSLVLFTSLVKLFLLSATGYLAVRFRLLSEEIVQAISRFIIAVSLPALIIATLGSKLDHSVLGILALGTVAAMTMNGIGLVFALLVRRLFIPLHTQGRGLFVSLSAMQNSGYLPIPLVAAVLPEPLQAQGLLLVFVYIVVMGALFWSMGLWLVSEGTAKDWRENIKQMANPPMIALIVGLLFLVPPIKTGFTAIPLIHEALTLIGNTTIPLVMVVLGGSFGSGIPLRGNGELLISVSALVKLVLTPLVALLVVKSLSMDRTFAFVLVLQASMPAAMNHIVVAREFGGNIPLTARALFAQYAVSIATIPIVLYAFDRL